MKLKKFISHFMSCSENLPLAVIDHEGNAMFLSWNYLNDAPEEKIFSLVLREAPFPNLDHKGLGLLLTHFLSGVEEEDIKTILEDYDVEIAWEESRLGKDDDFPFRTTWGSVPIQNMGIAGITWSGMDEPQKMFVFRVPALPDYEEVKSWS